MSVCGLTQVRFWSHKMLIFTFISRLLIVFMLLLFLIFFQASCIDKTFILSVIVSLWKACLQILFYSIEALFSVPASYQCTDENHMVSFQYNHVLIEQIHLIYVRWMVLHSNTSWCVWQILSCIGSATHINCYYLYRICHTHQLLLLWRTIHHLVLI